MKEYTVKECLSIVKNEDKLIDLIHSGCLIITDNWKLIPNNDCKEILDILEESGKIS